MNPFSIRGQLKSLRKIFSGQRSGRTRRNRQSTAYAAEVQLLEDRKMLTVTFHGGAVLPQVEVEPIFLGSQWNTNSTLSSQTAQINAYLPVLVGGAYMDMLTNAGYNVGRGTATSGVVDPVSITSPNGINDSAIQQDIQSLITNNGVQAPDANRLYIVYVESGVVITHFNQASNNGFLGYHGAFPGTTASGTSIDIHYAVIDYPGGPNYSANSQGFGSNFNELTVVTSHEVTEAATDPNVRYKTLGWYDDQNNKEIGDLAAGQQFTFQGYDVQPEVNKNDQLITPNEPPNAPQNVTVSALSPNNATVLWTDSSEPIQGYRVYEKVGRQSFLVGSVGASTSSFPVSGLIPGSTDTFFVESYIGQFNFDSATASITIPKLVTAPHNLVLTALSPNTAQLSWTASGGPVDGYHIYGYVGAQEVLLKTVNASSTSVQISGLVPGSINSFMVQAYEIGNFTADSALATITMPKLKLHLD